MSSPSRRMIPPLGALRALEALDRLGSATAVARELDLSQSAVSRQIRTLEETLGVPLVRRERRSLELLPAAKDYAGTVRESLQRIAQASVSLRLPGRTGSLDLAMLPSFGMHWLVPRLPDFTRRNPDITVHLTTRIRPCAFDSDPFDAAIEFATGAARPGTARLSLRPEPVVAVCAPTLVATPADPAALADLPHLQMATRPNAWPDWFAAHGVDAAPRGGTTFDQFIAMREGAQAGLGVALLPDYLVETALATGSLVRAARVAAVTLGAYYLVWPVDRPQSPALRHFHDWLAQQAEDEDDVLPR